MELIKSSKDLEAMSLTQLRALRDEYEKHLSGLTLKDDRYEVVRALSAVEDVIDYKENEPIYDPVTRQRVPAEKLNVDQIKRIIERNKRQIEALVERYLEGSDEEIGKLLDNLDNTQEALKAIHILGNGKKQPQALLTDLKRYFNEMLELNEELQNRIKNSKRAEENRKDIAKFLETPDPFLDGPNQPQ